MPDVRRRELMAVLGAAAAAAWPVAGRAQQPPMPVIGYLYSGAPEAGAPMLAAFRKGLRKDPQAITPCLGLAAFAKSWRCD